MTIYLCPKALKSLLRSLDYVAKYLYRHNPRFAQPVRVCMCFLNLFFDEFV